MDIVSSDIQLSSTRVFARQVTLRQSLELIAPGAGRSGPEKVQTEPEDSVHLRTGLAKPGRGEAPDEAHQGRHAALDPKTEVLAAMIEALTGKKVRLINPDHLTGQARAEQVRSDQDHERSRTRADQGKSSFGLAYDFSSTARETESTAFKAEGQVRTADGREIDIHVSMTMTRTLVRTESVSVRAGSAQLVDPLVVNFSGTAAQLSSSRFEFDLDMDGSDDSVHLPSAGSGFLALDRNKNGEVDDGGELFGPRTDNGFGELQHFDHNMDGWIDESDPVFPELRVWTRDEEGHDSLHALGRLGIGAIYLGRADSFFSLTDIRQELMAQVQSTGLFVREDGSAGTIQELDLSV